MVISGKINEEHEQEKIKAYINLEINGFQLRGFKIVENGINENGGKEYKLFFPSYLNEKSGKYEYPICINPELVNKKELCEKLENEVIAEYKEGLAYGVKHINREVKIKELEEGKLNISSFVINPKKVENKDFVLKTSNSMFIGAFKVKNVNLLYNSKLNDYNVLVPTHNEVKFLVPASADSYSVLKKALINSYQISQKEFKQNFYNKIKEAKLKNKEEEVGIKNDEAIKFHAK